nr:glycosyltransferase [uncultured Vibrio sp.]
MKKKVVILQNSIKTTFIFRMGYIKKLLLDGFEVIIVAPNDCLHSEKELKAVGAKVHRVPSINSKMDYFKVTLSMNLLILKYRRKNTIFICHFITTFILTYFTLVPFNSKCLVYIEGLGSLFSNKGRFQSFLKFLLVKSRVTRVFCNNDERAAVGLPDDRVSGGIGVDLNYFNTQKIFNNNEVFNLLYVGRLIEDKGVLDVIATLRYLIKKGKKVNLSLVGDIYANNPTSLSNQDVLRLEKEFGEVVNFVGFSQNVKQWYEQSDILLLPSRREGFPVCVMEANAMGLPAICYDVPGCSDAIKSDVNGYLVKAFDCNEYANVVEKALNPDVLKKMSKTSVAYAHENFDSRLKSSELVQTIKSLN